MKDLQEQVDTMIEKSEAKVEDMWNETSKFVNTLENKVLKKQENWVKIQEEVVAVQDQRLTSLEQYNIDLKKYEDKKERKMNKRIEDDKIKAQKYREREENIAAFLKEGNEFQAAIDEKVADLEMNKCNEEDTIYIVKKILTKFCENNQANQNLKRDNTHVIVSPLKKSRQTEENSGLMLTE